MGDAPENVIGWAARDPSGILSPIKFPRRATGPEDVRFKILYCGICHSDLHSIRNEWNNSVYPLVPGHEIVGVVTEVGAKVVRFKVGETVGVGCISRSCRSCYSCELGLEQYCPKMVWTYNDNDSDGTRTQGGYSGVMVANQHYLLRIPENLAKDGAAPLLCAGITVWSPMKYFGMDEKGKNFGVIGLGGLGHMAVLFAKALGMTVTVFSTSPNKEEEALASLGADHFIDSKDEEKMKAAAGTIDYIIDTASYQHSLDLYLPLLRTNGKLVLVGLPQQPLQVTPGSLVFGRRFVGGSLIGGIKETQEMLDFCGEHNITCRIEKIRMSYVNTAIERLDKSDVKYRFVIDVEKTLEADST